MAAKAELPAKRQMMVLMQQGVGWQEAARLTGIQVSRSTAYRWFQGFRSRGEEALRDGRHGHPAKVREGVSAFLQAICHQTPQMPRREVQTDLHKQFGLL